MKLYIKQMVSIRCKMAVETVLNNLGMDYISVELGHVELPNTISIGEQEKLKNELEKIGLELVSDKKSVLIEQIKVTIIEMVRGGGDLIKTNFSYYLSQKLNYDYTYMANVFSEVRATTIENYIIAQKIEHVKEMLIYDELTLTEISYKLNYSSVAHLSNQFKKFTGLTPKSFKNIQHLKRLNQLQ